MRDHTSLIAWQAARRVSVGCCQLSKDHWKPWLGAMFSQLLRSSLSVQLNIAEGYALWQSGQRRRHFRIAYGSAIETADLIDLLQTMEEVPAVKLESLIKEVRTTSRILLSWIKRLDSGGNGWGKP